MRRSVALSSIAALLVVVALSVFLGLRHPQTGANEAPSPLLGQTAPDFTAPLLGGSGRLSLARDRGDVVVLNFWASWCGPCKTEAPELSTFAWAERNHPVKLVGVVFDDSVGAAEQFATLYGSLYPSVVDAGGVIANEYGVTDPPTTFIVNAKGKVAVSLLGPVTATQLEADVARVERS